MLSKHYSTEDFYSVYYFANSWHLRSSIYKAFVHLSHLCLPSLPQFLNTSWYHQPQTVTTRSECELTDGMLLAAPCLPQKQVHHSDLDTAFPPLTAHTCNHKYTHCYSRIAHHIMHPRYKTVCSNTPCFVIVKQKEILHSSFFLSSSCYSTTWLTTAEKVRQCSCISLHLSFSLLKTHPHSLFPDCHINIWLGVARKSMSIGSWKEERGRFAHRSEVYCWILTGPLCCIGVLRKHIYSNIIDKVSTTLHLSKVDRYFIILWKEICFHSR